MNDFWNKILPGSVKTDHGKFNGADLLIIVLDLILLGYTCYRSFRFLQNTFAGNDTTGEYTVAAIVALVGLDIAAVAWSLVWMFGSTTKWQDVVSLLMFVVSIIGMVLTSMTDTLSGEGAVPEALKFSAYYGVPAIILLNVAAGITYHMISPQVALGRKERRLKADIRETQRLGEIAQKDTAMKLELAEKQMRQNDELIERQQRLAEQQIKIDGMNLGINQALSDDSNAKRHGAAVRRQIESNVAPPQPALALNSTAPALPPQDVIVQHVGGWRRDTNGNIIPEVVTQAPAAPTYVSPEVAAAIERYQFDDNARAEYERVYDLIAQFRVNAGRDGVLLDDIVIDNSHDNEGDAARLASAIDLYNRLHAAYDQRRKARIIGKAPKA